MQAYQTNRPINRPILRHAPWWQVDEQSLPPYLWCECCGAEVYDPVENRCIICLSTHPEKESIYDDETL